MAVKKVRAAKRVDSDNPTTTTAELAIAVRKMHKRARPKKKPRVRKSKLGATYTNPECRNEALPCAPNGEGGCVACDRVFVLPPFTDMLENMPGMVHRLDRLCDQINDHYRKMEAELRKINIEISLPVEEKLPLETWLGFTRLGDQWRIVMSQQPHIATNAEILEKRDVRAWENWPRAVKIKCAYKLYDLYIKAYDAVEHLIDDAEQFLGPNSQLAAAASYGAELDRGTSSEIDEYSIGANRR